MLTRSKDRKVANSVTPNGKQANIANAFGLPSGVDYSCPNATAYCSKICYAGKLEKLFKGVRIALMSNWEQVKDADYFELVTLLGDMLDDFRKDCTKRNADMLFRIHWDGDFFKQDYTLAWRTVIELNPDIQFWVYTRVPSAYELLKGIPNLSLYFSADPDNLNAIPNGARVAYVADTFAAGKAEFAKATRCPENNKAIALISEKGSACKRCGLCINARNDVLFSRTKR